MSWHVPRVRNGSSTRLPVPDPTALTIEAQEKAIAQGRLDLAAAMELVDSRINRLRVDLDAIEGHHDQSLEHWTKLIEERFDAVQQLFDERAARATETAVSGKEALAAAFASAKELSALATEHFKAEISALKSQADERSKSVDQQLGALKEQLDRGEPRGYGLGERAQKVDRRQADTLLISVVSVLLVAMSVVFAVYVATHP